jgi:hypothetical protein
MMTAIEMKGAKWLQTLPEDVLRKNMGYEHYQNRFGTNVPPLRAKALCRGVKFSGVAKPSIVVISQSVELIANDRHARTGEPSFNTVQVPQIP